ncbi:hypothetical protein PG996_002934 [Apiospora saccharicola]|uniref:Uncharacterized protein n=1 Tax=Apiospora saccharicola TaxID=335842 RepID=A0ABR1WQ61_9PEZI
MSAEPSFPQFSRLPPELRLKILDHHRDSLGRNHDFRNSTLFYTVGNSVRISTSSTTYNCKSLHGDFGSAIKNDARDDDDDRNPAMTDCIYAGDGLASERIPLYHDFHHFDRSSASRIVYGRFCPAGFCHGWANFATDVFTFANTSQQIGGGPTQRPPTPSLLGALEKGTVCPLDYGGHWFWRVQKLALHVGGNNSLPSYAYALSEYDKEVLRRTTRELKTVYVVVRAMYYYCTATGSVWSRCPCVSKEAAPPFPDPGGREMLLPRYPLRRATQLKGELESVLRDRPIGGGGRRRPVEVLVVFSETKGWEDRRWEAVAQWPN